MKPKKDIQKALDYVRTTTGELPLKVGNNHYLLIVAPTPVIEPGEDKLKFGCVAYNIVSGKSTTEQYLYFDEIDKDIKQASKRMKALLKRTIKKENV